MSATWPVALGATGLLLLAACDSSGDGAARSSTVPAILVSAESTVPPPTTGAEFGSPYDPDATMRPDLMVVEPAQVGPGANVAVTYPGGRERGVAYVLERSRDGKWHTTHFMTAANDSPDRVGAEPSWVEFGTPGYGWEAIGISGPGPDTLVIPPYALVGAYRICTANSVENICAEIGIVEPDDAIPFDTGSSAPVAELLGLPLDEFTAGVVELGYGPVRVTWRDGEFVPVTEDLLPGRVAAAVEQRDGIDVVIDARVEADSDDGWLGGEATIVGIFDGVSFYPACGNEPLELDGVVWYQVQQAEYPEIYDRAVNGSRENLPDGVGPQGFAPNGFAPRVAPPGPGDDVGTLVVWSDDVAYFVSDSGDLSAWLVREELTYRWEC